MAACYNGPDPFDNEQGRMAIWAWAKKKSGIDPLTGRETGGGIDEGRSFEDVHDAINRHFYNGFSDPAWITDKLAGRKTPLKPFSMAAWKAESNRRAVTRQAKGITEAILKKQKQGPLERGLGAIFDAPRTIAVAGHSVGLGAIHPGDLVFQPRNMGLFYQNLFHVWDKAFPLVTAKRAARDQAAVDQYTLNMKKNANFDMALYAKLDVGEGSAHGNNLVGKAGSPTDRAWDLLKITRFKLWNGEYEKALKRNPSLTEAEKREVAKGLAQMANHATGSSGGMPKEISPLLFGPKLTASKISRLVGDPLQTARTIFNPNATPAERIVANRRLSRAVQYLGTVAGFLGANWGLNKALGVKDDENVNWTDPTRADYMSFKTGGLEWSVPGLHTEIKFLANVIAIAAQQFGSQKALNKASRGQGQWGELQKSFGQYALNKVVPGGQIGLELFTGHNWQGRPLPEPWVDQKGTKFAPPFGFNPKLKGAAHLADASAEYALEHAPIPFAGPIRYVYDQLRAGGASAGDTLSVIRGLAMAGLGLTGLHVSPDYAAAKAEAKRAAAAKALGH